jgi:hypothetical protein
LAFRERLDDILEEESKGGTAGDKVEGPPGSGEAKNKLLANNKGAK